MVLSLPTKIYFKDVLCRDHAILVFLKKLTDLLYSSPLMLTFAKRYFVSFWDKLPVNALWHTEYFFENLRLAYSCIIRNTMRLAKHFAHKCYSLKNNPLQNCKHFAIVNIFNFHKSLTEFYVLISSTLSTFLLTFSSTSSY